MRDFREMPFAARHSMHAGFPLPKEADDEPAGWPLTARISGLSLTGKLGGTASIPRPGLG